MKKAILAAVAALALPSSAQAANYVLATPDCTINADGWCLGGSNMDNFRTALGNLANFGSGGTVGDTITVVYLTDFTNLSGVNGILVPWWNDAQSASHVSNIVSFFQAGGDLLMLNDDTAHDAIGAALGIPSLASAGSASNGLSPLFQGPFGAAANVTQAGNTGYFTAADIAGNGGSIGGTNGSGEATSAYWNDGAYAAGAGRMVMLGDVDMVSDFGSANYATLNGNARFALNSVAYLLGGNAAVPEPSTWAMMILGFGVVGAARRKRTKISAALA